MSPRLVLAAGLLPLLAGCAGGGLVGDTFRPDVYVVRSGDTLYSIAWRYGLDHRQLQRWNEIESPDRLRVGQSLRLSAGGDSAARQDTGAGQPPRSGDARAGRVETEAAPAGDPADAPGSWRWPAEGSLIGTFGDGRVAGRGIDIGGDRRSPIIAAANGEVVYSGEGLQAYGQLVIIRHGSGFLSAYAHNDRLLVDEGQRVVAGQQIARMGTTNNGRALLHFEIRRQGTPVDPLDYLPARD